MPISNLNDSQIDWLRNHLSKRYTNNDVLDGDNHMILSILTEIETRPKSVAKFSDPMPPTQRRGPSLPVKCLKCADTGYVDTPHGQAYCDDCDASNKPLAKHCTVCKGTGYYEEVVMGTDTDPVECRYCDFHNPKK